MMFRGDQHVDDWAEVAVDYLDGRLDPETRLAVERHLAGCPECAARLHTQHSVVNLLQETPLYDPPGDLEYRAIGELIFPSPGGRPIAAPVPVERPTRAPRWVRSLRAWLPAAVAVVALFAAVIGYTVARSGSGGDMVVTGSGKSSAGVTTTAAGATTVPEAFGEATLAGAADTMTTAGATTTAVASVPPSSTETAITLAPTQDRKTMIRELEKAQAPAYVSFRAPVALVTTDDTSLTTVAAGGTETTPGGAGDTPITATDTTASPGPGTTAPERQDGMTVATVSATQADSIVAQIESFTGLEPLDESLWLDGPTFAVFLPREDAEELVDLVRSIGSSLGLVVRLEGGPPKAAENSPGRLLENKYVFPVLAAQRALQPSVWNYDFTTSTLIPASGERSATQKMPDEEGTHVLLVIWIAE
jgi:hypothetical protein